MGEFFKNVCTAIFVLAVLVAIISTLTGCGHNTGAFTVGSRVNLGLDPANATANISYVDGLNVIDVSRENSEWELTIDADNGVSVDAKTGNIKGVKSIKRKIGIQVTGYLVELAEKNPDLAKFYIEKMVEAAKKSE